ncbi:MAG TPA: META domain-containing protein [Anaerolineales bacterium]
MKLRSLSFITLVLTAAFAVLAACGTGASGDPLSGTSWNLASVDGAAALPDVKVTAVFKDGQVSGTGGCNSYGGKYRVSGEKLEISEVVSTLMACSGEGIMDQESSFLGGLDKAKSFTLSDGKLEIGTSDGKTLVFAPG